MEHVNKKIKVVNDENVGRIMAAKPAVVVGTVRLRGALTDIANQKPAANALKAIKVTEQGKVQKPLKPKTIKAVAVPKPRSKIPVKPSSDMTDAGFEDIASIIDAGTASDEEMGDTQPLEEEEETEMASVRETEQTEEESYTAKLERLGIVNIDLEDADDPLAVTEYVADIFKYLLELEDRFQPQANYIITQIDITWKMRSTLVNWLVEVHWKYKLYPETLFLTVNIMDRYLAIRHVTRDILQLVGVASMLIASKFEEIYSPSIEDFLYVCNDSYTRPQLLKTERDILCALGFNLGNPCPLTFLRRISKAEQYDIPSRTVAKYLIEVTILDERFLKFKPSLLAAASSWLARKMLKKGDWDKTLTFYSGYSERELEPCVNELLSFLQQNTKFRAIFKKYSSSKFLRASVFVEQKINAWSNNEEGPTPPADLVNS